MGFVQTCTRASSPLADRFDNTNPPKLALNIWMIAAPLAVAVAAAVPLLEVLAEACKRKVIQMSRGRQ